MLPTTNISENPITHFAPQSANAAQQLNNPLNTEDILKPDQELLDYETVKPKLLELTKSWKVEEQDTAIRRKMRKIEINIAQLQKEGLLKADETFIPIRVIDSNIRKEQPSYVAFLKQSRRIAIFKCLSNTNINTSLLEEEFTTGMTYVGWELPIFKALDGAQTHGWDSVEIEFNTDRPLHVNIDHVGHDNLIFPRDSKDIQACEILMRKYEITISTLKKWVKNFGFEAGQCDLIIQKRKDKNEYRNITVYKAFIKIDGVVWVAWYSDEEAIDWLKKPSKLFLGRKKKVMVPQTSMQQQPSVDPMTGQPIMTMVPTTVNVPQWQNEDETLFPIKLFKYKESEETSISEYRGRCFEDSSKQEAQTALWSIFVNGSVRAGNVYASPDRNDDTGPLKKLDLNLEHGCIYSSKLNFWHTEWPDPGIIRGAAALETQTQVETGQVAFAAVNNQDSRKTAKEISVAEQQASLLSGVQVALFSTFLREVYTHCWLVVQSQALQGLITFLQIPNDTATGNIGMPSPMVNDMATISEVYDVRAAGDVDVIERAERLQRRQLLWPIVSQTALATDFLIDILKETLPEDAKRYEMIIRQQQNDAKNGEIQNLLSVITEIVLDDNGQLKPEYSKYAPQLQQLNMQAKTAMSNNPLVTQPAQQTSQQQPQNAQ